MASKKELERAVHHMAQMIAIQCAPMCPVSISECGKSKTLKYCVYAIKAHFIKQAQAKGDR